MTHKQPGLDSRHRDADGRISTKHSNTRVDTLRGIYGDNFAPDVRGDMHLGTLLERNNAESLGQYLKDK